MKKMNKGRIATILFVSMLIGIAGVSYGQTYHRDYLDGQVFFKFKDNVAVDIPVNPDRTVDLDKVPMLNNLRANYSVTALSRPLDLNNDPRLLRTFLLEFGKFEEVEEIMADLSQNPNLEYVEPVALYYIDYQPDDSLYNLTVGQQNWNWHLDVIHAEQAWDMNLGSSDIKVAIVDNAVWKDHPDLANKVVLSTDVTTVGGNSNPPGTGSAADWSHGTHCAGLIGAETNNGIGVASIGHNISLIGVKSTTNTNPTLITHSYAGLQWAINNGADVVSMSFGGPGFNNTFQNLVNTGWSMGVSMLASAGNDNVSSPHYPSAYNHVISVASTNEDDIKSDFSNYGTSIDVCAPGGYGILGPNGLMSTTYENTSYGYYNTYFGTSMATPVAAGLVGLIRSINPDLTPDEVEAILKSTCVNIDTLPGNATWSGLLGEGRIDAYAAALNTPFTPTADFYTPVPYITPGTTIPFYDMSVGVPEIYSWEFPGGTPYLSSEANPEVTYATEGVYTVYLGVTNDFGTDVETKTDYITVTSTPLPWIVFSADKEYTCAYDTVILTDQSLYEPTSWLWTFEPNTVSFVDGTDETSQNPHVIFEGPGTYSVTLDATNEHGTNTLTKTDMIEAEGIVLNFSEDFESGASNGFVISANWRAKASIDHRAAAPGSEYGLHFQGSGETSGWSGGAGSTTPEQAWNVNVDFHGFASNCNVDATGIQGVSLILDLRQTFSVGPRFSWFRVMANDTQIPDMNGVANFNPSTNSDPFETKIFDLSAYGNSMFSLTLQASCYLLDGLIGQGDNVFIDNILISNNTSTGNREPGTAGVLTYPNPVKDVLNFSADGTGSDLIVKVLNTQGQVVYSRTMKSYKDGQVVQLHLSQLKAGIYLLQLAGEDGIVTKKFVKQ